MQTFRVTKIYKPTLPQSIAKNDWGFSLIEILVTIAVISLVFMFIPNNFFDTEHEDMKESVAQILRATHLAQDEAILGHRIARIRFDLEKNPIEFKIELAENENLLFEQEVDTSKLSKDELTAFKKKKEDFDSQFSEVTDMQESELKLPLDVIFVAVGKGDKQIAKPEKTLSIYFYPSGEKDEMIIFLGNQQEIGKIEFNAFSDIFDEEFFALNNTNTSETIIQGQFEKWIKN